MIRHSKTHFNVKNHECHNCSKVFSRKELLQKHFRSCLGNNPNISDKHNTSGSKKNTPEEKKDIPESRNNTSERKNDVNLTCDHCDKSFQKKQNLKRHIRTHIKTSTESFSCEICDKRFFRKDNMMAHNKSHQEKSHQCSYCKKYFSKKFTLERHIEANHKVSFPNGGTFFSQEQVKAPCNIKCTYCVKKFSSKQNLKLHVVGKT